MKKSIESKIRLNVVLLYFFIALVCAGFVFFFYSLSEQLRAQKTTYEEYYTDLSVVNDLTQAVNKTQVEANLYVYTRNKVHLNNFRREMSNIEFSVDSLRNTYNLPIDSIWDEISIALKIKENSITALNEQLVAQDEIIVLRERALNKSIREIENKQLQDTIVQIGEKKSFWKRVANVFNPDEKIDTLIVVKQEQVNVVPDEIIDNTDDLVKNLKATQNNYNKRIRAIEEQIKKLVLADQDISSKISDLLIQLNTQIIHARWDEMDREEKQLQKSNKQALWLGIAALVLIFIFILLIIADVNKGQKLRKALEEANQRNREIMESRHKLLLSVSHDIKTPLNSILGYLEILQQNEHLTEKEIASMQNSGKHILSLLSNLLEFSSLEQGKLQLANSDFLLNELCDELYEMFAPLAKAKKLSFTYEKDFDPDLALYSDPLMIKQIVTNILSNAIKYTRKGSVAFKISYRKGFIGFVVNDTGVGIPKDKLDSIYQPFTRIDENNSLAEGSGFGMYVVKGLVQLFHGKIQYQSKEGEGTSVAVSLPAEKGKVKPEDHILKNILLIDDDSVFVSMVNRMCTQLGHRVTACKTWSEFENQLPKISVFDMVLTDMEMTTFTGQDILAKIREVDSEIPVILMTGRMDYNAQLAQSEGFAGYTGKPITLKRLYLIVGGIFNEKQEENIGEFLGEDSGELVVQVIEEFLFSAVNNVVELREAVDQDDFKKAQAICHKMRPMCVQLNASEELTDIMKEIDSFRKAAPETYRWEEKIMVLITGLEEFMSEIQEKYF